MNFLLESSVAFKVYGYKESAIKIGAPTKKKEAVSIHKKPLEIADHKVLVVGEVKPEKKENIEKGTKPVVTADKSNLFLLIV